MKTQVLELPGIRLWLARSGDVEPWEWAALYRQMEPPRRARCGRYRREEDRRRCVLADALARVALTAGTELDPGAVSFGREPGGKPYALGLERQFSLSHSGSLALCAVARFPVGADVQRRRDVSEAMLRRLAKAGYEGASEEEFFRWWTRQEAACKLDGRGLVLGPLPQDARFYDGRLEEPDGQYFYCVCAGA